MKNVKKIYYVPGIITLFFLPILCVLYLNNFIKEERILEITVCGKYEPNKNADMPVRMDTSILSQPGNIRIYTDIEMGTDTTKNNKSLNLFKERLCKLKTDDDTIHGIHIVFGNSMKYKYFIKSIDVCYKCDSFPSFAIYENNLWTAYWKYSKEKLQIRRNRLRERLIEDKERRNDRAFANISIPFNTKLMIKAAILTLAFLLLSYVSIRKMNK